MRAVRFFRKSLFSHYESIGVSEPSVRLGLVLSLLCNIHEAAAVMHEEMTLHNVLEFHKDDDFVCQVLSWR